MKTGFTEHVKDAFLAATGLEAALSGALPEIHMVIMTSKISNKNAQKVVELAADQLSRHMKEFLGASSVIIYHDTASYGIYRAEYTLYGGIMLTDLINQILKLVHAEENTELKAFIRKTIINEARLGGILSIVRVKDRLHCVPSSEFITEIIDPSKVVKAIRPLGILVPQIYEPPSRPYAGGLLPIGP